MNRKALVILLVVITGLGMVYSVWDYKKWRFEETKNYGHGPGEKMALAEQLTQRYENSGMGIRLGYPSNWKMVDNPQLLRWQDNKQLSWMELVAEGEKVDVVKVSWTDEISLQINLQRLVTGEPADLENVVDKLKAEGVEISPHREYINTDRENWMILSWEDGDTKIQEAVMVKKDRVITIRVNSKVKSINRWKLTSEEIIRSVKIF